MDIETDWQLLLLITEIYYHRNNFSPQRFHRTSVWSWVQFIAELFVKDISIYAVLPALKAESKE